MVKTFLDSKNVKFTTVDVTHDRELQAELHRKTGMLTVPITTDGKDFVAGWQPGKIMELIKNQ